MSEPLPFGDHPIEGANEDRLDRLSLAELIADTIASMGASQGAVVGLLGTWGSGKTSLLNLVVEQLGSRAGVEAVIRFNPWMFSGVDQLTGSLLSEVVAQLHKHPRGWRARQKAHKLFKALSRYGSAFASVRLIPAVGGMYDAAVGAVDGAAALTAADESLSTLHAKAREALAGLDGRLVVAIDDIDRLTKAEIRDLLRAVRLTAQFPNVIYLLCMDEFVVSSAIEERGFDGHAYLEKMLTLTITVPAISAAQINELFLASLNSLVDNSTANRVDVDVWRIAYPYAIAPMLTNLRDPKRLLSSLPLALGKYSAELPQVDIITLEAARVLRPRLHDAILRNAHLLTTPAETLSFQDEPQGRDRLAPILAAEPPDSTIAQGIVAALFPEAVSKMSGVPFASRSQPGVDTAAGMAFYVSGQLPPGSARPSQLTAIINAFGDRNKLAAAFERVPPDRLRSTLKQLVSHCSTEERVDVAETLPPFVDQFARVPESEPAGMLDAEPRVDVSRCVYQLLRRASGERVYEVVVHYVANSERIYPAHELVMMVGHRPNAGHRIVTPEQAEGLEDAIKGRLRAAGNDLRNERQLLSLLYHGLQPDPAQTDPALPVLREPEVAANLFKSALTGKRTTDLTSGRTSHQGALHWDIVVELMGGEINVQTAMQQIRADAFLRQDAADALALMDKYLVGWRPDDPFKR